MSRPSRSNIDNMLEPDDNADNTDWIMNLPAHKQQSIIEMVQLLESNNITQQEFNDRALNLHMQSNEPPIDFKRAAPETLESRIKRSKLEMLSTPKPISRAVNIPTRQPTISQPQEVELDLEGMMDVTNYAGVDLKQEEFSLNDMSRKTNSRYRESPFLNLETLETKVLEIGEKYGVEDIDESYCTFVSQATEAYMIEVLEKMCQAADHRAVIDFDIFNRDLSNTAFELEIQEKDETAQTLREIEQRERLEQNTLMASVGARPIEEVEGMPSLYQPSTPQNVQAQGKGDKKIKRSSKKDLPEAVKNKLANNAAMMAVGGTMKAWMLPGASMSQAPKSAYRETPKQAQNQSMPPSSSRTSTQRNRTQKRITIKDALVVMQDMRVDALSYKWWSSVK